MVQCHEMKDTGTLKLRCFKYIYTYICGINEMNPYEMLVFLLNAIKWTIMEKAKFGLHLLNAETKNAFPEQHSLEVDLYATG